jgi:hypothetical protein
MTHYIFLGEFQGKLHSIKYIPKHANVRNIFGISAQKVSETIEPLVFHHFLKESYKLDSSL